MNKLIEINEYVKECNYELSIFTADYQNDKFSILIAPYWQTKLIKDLLQVNENESVISALTLFEDLLYPYFIIGSEVEKALNDLEDNLKNVEKIFSEISYSTLLEYLRDFMSIKEKATIDKLELLRDCIFKNANEENYKIVHALMIEDYEKHGIVCSKNLEENEFVNFLKYVQFRLKNMQ